jgi:hypothetical protein
MLSVVSCSFRWVGIDIRVTRATDSQGAQGAKRSDVHVGSMWPRSWRSPAGSLCDGAKAWAVDAEPVPGKRGVATVEASKEGAGRPYCGVPPRRRVQLSARGDIHCGIDVLGRQICLWDARCIGGRVHPFSVPDATMQGMTNSSQESMIVLRTGISHICTRVVLH